MKVIGIICIVLAAVLIGGVICCLCAADEDNFSEWEDEHNEQNR